MKQNSQVSEIQVSYTPSLLVDMSIKNSKKSFELMLNEWEQETLQMQEEVKILLLNRNNKVLGIYSLAKGGLTSCVVDVRIILSIALKTLATGIILVHNHPSGNLKPSKADLDITKKLKQSCDLLDITFDTEDYETLNGFMIAQLHRLPVDNENGEVDYEGYHFKVLEAKNRVIRKVRITKLEGEENKSNDSNTQTDE
jgi:hypothetical protein